MPSTDRLTSQFRAAQELWDQIKIVSSPADRFLGNYFHQHRKIFGSRDRRFLSEIIYSLFRHKTFLETWAEVISSKKDTKLLVLLAAVCERIIDPVDLDPKIAQKIQSRSLPDGLSFKTHEERLSVECSFPLWLIQKWFKQFGEKKAELLIRASLHRPPLTLRTNTLKITRDELIRRFQNKAFSVNKTPQSKTGITFKERVSLFDSEEFKNGLFEIQDEGSQLVCEAIHPEPGQMVWDVCAGGGGKSLAMAAHMKNQGRIVATDLRAFKLEELRKRAKRAGINTIFPADLNRMDEMAMAKKGFDLLVVDAPCSGTGTLRRNPDAKWKLSAEVFEKNHQDQVMIMEKSLPYLKRGGKLCYITCSLEPEENEKTFEAVLKNHSSLALQGDYFKLFPHENGTDGFFLAIAENRF